ncbi:MAG: hypothetical protein CMJ59_05325 [Planctomycetaceae bacterium]|nr:hypothetical protein [Planctomycetaceae bacterium]
MSIEGQFTPSNRAAKRENRFAGRGTITDVGVPSRRSVRHRSTLPEQSGLRRIAMGVGRPPTETL